MSVTRAKAVDYQLCRGSDGDVGILPCGIEENGNSDIGMTLCELGDLLAESGVAGSPASECSRSSAARIR
jgi:hypothetical protein